LFYNSNHTVTPTDGRVDDDDHAFTLPAGCILEYRQAATRKK
jgi:hypothetical protein